MSSSTTPTLREAMIPVFMQFGMCFDPIERPAEVNMITDKAIDAILTLLHDRMLALVPEKIALADVILNPTGIAKKHAFNEAIDLFTAAIEEEIGKV